MKLSWAARRRWSLVLLLVGLPLYIVAAVTIMNRLDRPGFVVEFVVYVALGVLWALPFRFVFLGIGRADPDAAPGPEPTAEITPGRDAGDGADGGTSYSDSGGARQDPARKR
jgi:hypothetical protein